MSLEPKERFTVGIRKQAIKYIVGMNKNLSYNEVIYIIRSILKELKEIIIIETETWIDSKVPKRTGQLRENLKEYLRESNIFEHTLRIILGTTIDYAEQVAGMSTAQVRHHGEIGYVNYWNPFGIRGRVILNDPRAIGNFWDHLVQFVIERVHANIGKLKAKYAQTTNITVSNLSKMEVT